MAVRGLTVLLVLAFVTCAAADGQVMYRRDVKERPAELSIDGRLYKPAGQFKLWEFRIHPFFSETLTYDDNIFLASHRGNTEEDFIARTVAGLRADLPVDRHELLLGYQLKGSVFAKNGDQDTLEHDGFLSGSLNFDWFYLDLSERIERLSDPADLVNAARVDRLKNTVTARLGFFFRPMMIEVGWENRWFDFEDPLQSLDRMENYLWLTAHVLLREDSKALQQVFAFVETEFAHYAFRTSFNNDSNYTTLWAGAKGTLMEDFPFLIKVGYCKQIASSSGTNPDHRDFEGFVWAARLTYRLDDHYALSLASYRRVEVSGSSNYRLYDRGELAAEVNFPPTITENLFARVHVFFDTADPSDAPVYSRMGAGFRVEYYFQDWGNVGLSYEYRYRYTNMTAGDYRDNQVSLHATLFF